MTKLKTLKDIDSFGIEFISRIKLRDTAREWIKYYNKKADKFENSDRELMNFYLGKIDCLRDFFNLEETK